MLTVKKFLFCFRLEAGGYFLGWLGIISSLLLGLGFIASLAFSLQDIVDLINMRFSVADKSRLPILIILIVFAIFVSCLLLNLHISILLIRGTENQKFRQLKPFLIVQALFIFLLTLEALSTLRYALFIPIVIGIYCWIVVYSLYETFKIDERLKIDRYEVQIQNE